MTVDTELNNRILHLCFDTTWSMVLKVEWLNYEHEGYSNEYNKSPKLIATKSKKKLTGTPMNIDQLTTETFRNLAKQISIVLCFSMTSQANSEMIKWKVTLKN